MVHRALLPFLVLALAPQAFAQYPDDPQAPVAPPPAADAAAARQQDIPEITVTGEKERGYATPAAASATRTFAPLLETPLSAAVVPEQVMRDQGVQSLADALQNVAGVKSLPSYVPYDTIQGRGFAVTPFRDGVRRFFVTIPVAAAERVEVLKGPSAVQYGRLEPGGMVNVVSRTPAERAAYALEQQATTFGGLRTLADATGPIAGQETVLYRVTAEWLDDKSFLDKWYSRRLYVTPVVEWRPREGSGLSLALEYRDQRTPSDPGVPALGDRPVQVPLRRYYGEPGLRDRYQALGFYLRGQHRLTDSLTLRAGGTVYRGDYQYGGIYQNSLDQADGRTLARGFGLYSDYDKRNTADAYVDLVLRGELLGTVHTLLAGVDAHQDAMRANWADITGLPDVTLDDPGYGQVDVAAVRAQTPNAWFISKNSWLGAYAQDQVRIGERWHLLLGARYDWARSRSGFDAVSFENAEAALSSEYESRLSPRAGAVFKVLPWLSLFASYSRSFGGSNGRSSDDRPLPPEIGIQWEGGLKVETPDRQLGATLVFFDLAKRNLATPDPTTPDPFDSRVVGEAKSTGIELDLSGRIGRAWSVIASLSLMNPRYTRDDGGLQGQRLQNAARRSGSAWVTYAFQGEALRGLTLGGGVFASSEVEGAFLSSLLGSEESVILPSWMRADVMASYRFSVSRARLTAQLNVENLLDKRYYVGAGGRNEIHPGAPRSLLGSLKIEL